MNQPTQRSEKRRYKVALRDKEQVRALREQDKRLELPKD